MIGACFWKPGLRSGHIIPIVIVLWILNQSGNQIVSYIYDAWGNILTTTGTTSATTLLAERNPLRYRGYVYDAETTLYYLQSRYYDPKTEIDYGRRKKRAVQYRMPGMCTVPVYEFTFFRII